MNHKLLEKIKSVPQLPSPPAIAVRVLELAKQPNASVETVAKVISNDPALSAKVLRTINSSFYGLPQQVTTINRALVLLGMQSVKTLALGFSLTSALSSRRSSTFDYTRFWRQSLFSAVASRTLAKAIQYRDPEEAFLIGLLSDVGTLAMHWALGREYDVLLEASQGDQVELVRLSREKFGLDHAQVGGAIAEHWKFPTTMAEPIRRHHNLSENGNQPGGLIEIVYSGVLCGQVFAAKRAGLIERAKSNLIKRFNLEDARINAIFQEIDSQFNELVDLFEVKIEPGRSYHDIEQEARQTLVEITLQLQLQSRQVELQNQQLKAKATTDGLTGLANRGRFAEFIGQAFEEASRSRQPLSLLFLDVDKFKSINDTHGHQAGDEVLERLGRFIKSMVNEADLAARYGGEEIAIVLKDKDSFAATQIAECVRHAVQEEQISFEGKQIPVTISIGVATANAEQQFLSSDELVGAADKAVYAAKEAGRNCVRVCFPAVRCGAA